MRNTSVRVIIHAPHLNPKPRAERIASSYVARTPPAEPTALELVENFAGAMERWAAIGFKTVTAGQYAARSAACNQCELWDGKARLGLGKCKAPSCGCTLLKRWLTSEACLHPEGSRWAQMQPPAEASNP
jgi:hypothetical protein